MNEPTINGVSLHDHLEALAQAERARVDERFRLEKEAIRAEFEKIDKATRLQADEYARRLDDLNHANEHARDILATYLPRVAFDTYVKQQEAKADAVKVVLDETRDRLDGAVRDLAQSVEKTRVETAARLENQIAELRDQNNNFRGAFVHSEVYTQRHEDLQGKVANISDRLATLEGGTTYKTTTIGWLLAGLGLLITIVVTVVNLLTSGASP